MKAFFFSEEMIVRLIETIKHSLEEYRWRISDKEMAKRIVEEIKEFPIEINEVSVSSLDRPCKFVPLSDIVGFVRSQKGDCKGVFVKQ